MSISNDDWRDIKRDTRRVAWFGARWTVIIAVFVAVLAIAGSVLALQWDAWFAGTKGDLETEIRDQDVDNRVRAQAFFLDTYNGIMRFDDQLNDAQKALDDYLANTPKPNNSDSVAVQLYTQEVDTRQTTITGLQQQCRNAISSYNAETDKILSDEWRDSELPYKIDESNSETDCQPDNA